MVAVRFRRRRGERPGEGDDHIGSIVERCVETLAVEMFQDRLVRPSCN